MTRKRRRPRREPAPPKDEPAPKPSPRAPEAAAVGPGGGWQETALWVGLLVAVTLVAYWPAIHAGFIWDDDLHITRNALLKDAAGLRRIWLDPTAMPQYYPLVFSSFWVEYQLWELAPLGYHLDNVLLHAASAVVLWRLLLRLELPAAWLAAAVFAIHPVHVESVAWATERKNVLSGLFYLGALSAYLRFALPARRPWGWYAAACLLFVCALLAKTVTASLPAAAALVVWWKQGRLGVRDLVPLAPLAAGGVALGLHTAQLEQVQVGATGADWAFSFVDRCLIAGRAVWFYAAKLLWPHPLVFIYPRWQIDAGAWWQYLFPLGAAAGVAALWLARHRLGRGPVTAVLFFGGTLFPALGFVNVFPMRFSFVADHFQYLASIGLIALGAGAAGRLCERLAVPRRARQGLAAVVLAVLGLLTWRQGTIYASAETVYEDTLAKNPDCWLAHNNLGMLLAERGDQEPALAHYGEAIRLRAGYTEAHNNRANLLSKMGRATDGIDDFREVLRSKPTWAMGRSNFAVILIQVGRYDEAIEQAEAALRIDPRLPQAHNALATALAKTGRPGDAIAHYREALRLMPGWPPAERRLAWVLATYPDAQWRDPAEALRLARHASERTGGRDPEVLDALAAAAAAAGELAEAEKTAGRAAALAAEAGKAELAADIERRAALYRAGQPYVEALASP